MLRDQLLSADSVTSHRLNCELWNSHKKPLLLPLMSIEPVYLRMLQMDPFPSCVITASTVDEAWSGPGKKSHRNNGDTGASLPQMTWILPLSLFAIINFSDTLFSQVFFFNPESRKTDNNSRNNLTQPVVNLFPYRHWGDSLIVPFAKDPQGGWGGTDYYVKLMLNNPCFSKATS